MILRDYQQRTVDSAFAHWEGGVRRLLAIAATGAGKTIIAAEIMRRANGPCLFLADAETLVTQNACKFKAHTGEECGVEMAAQKCGPDHRVVIASAQSLVRRLDKYPRGHFKTIICDECFPAGTMIGEVLIERIKVGDSIDSFNESTGRIEKAKVIDVFSNTASRLVEIKAGGTSIKATEQHPFFTQKGWIPACQLTEQHFLLMYEKNHNTEVRLLRERVCDQNKPTVCSSPESFKQMGMLQALPECNHVGASQGEESDVQRGIAHEDEELAERAAFSREAWREWSGASVGASNHCRSAQLENGIGDSDEARSLIGIPELLQSGHRQRDSQDCHRNRRPFPQHAFHQSCGCKEGCLLEWTRVESVSVQEVGCSTESGRGGGRCAVFNLTVEPNNTYIANGFVVHNCHRNSLGAYPQAIFAHFPDANLLGLTATPWRMDGSSLGDVYEKVVANISLAELMNAGHLCRVSVKSIPLSVDMRQVRRIAGDYSLDDIAEAIRPHLVAAVEQIKAHTQGRKVAVYLPLCSISREFAALCNASGLRAVHVDGDDKAGLAIFESGGADIICNASLLTTGWDYPPLDCVMILRPTRSLSLYAQIVGRGTRTAPGKTDCLLLDPLFLSDDHELVRPADMGASRRREKGDPVPQQDGDLLAIVRDAEAMHARSVAAKAREAERKAKREADLLAIRAIPEWERAPTPAQLWTLRKAGTDMSKVKTYADAKRALIRVFAMRRK